MISEGIDRVEREEAEEEDEEMEGFGCWRLFAAKNIREFALMSYYLINFSVSKLRVAKNYHNFRNTPAPALFRRRRALFIAEVTDKESH